MTLSQKQMKTYSNKLVSKLHKEKLYPLLHHGLKWLPSSRYNMWWVFLGYFVAAADWFPGVESQPSKYGEKVRIDVYYETNDIMSKKFITRVLHPLYKDINDFVDIHLIPFGKAFESYNSVTKRFDVRCRHGPTECYGDRVQSCAISLYPNIEDHLEFINCMEHRSHPSAGGEKCSRKMIVDWKNVSNCTLGILGDKLLHENAQRTKSLSPPLISVPWIVINNVHLEVEMFSDVDVRESLENMKATVKKFLLNN